ncbi:PREDICTED: telomere-associated protein RIF1 isoform X1 [Thamnophis sirtalis]|uniref:Telomere-associated protein RIF1 isoform X1 n=1 Tax=Thamnophis sirtalis TaxID=35019 RepID=A0A6I9X7E1_9SAUR|nr:PREDICTED: telomere-associated protein RIF1 isoform X1 [Thamnophis sirtalis]
MGPCDGSSMRALLETLEDPSASPGVLTDAWLTLTNRLTEEEEDEDEGKEFAAEVENCFPQLYKLFMTHIPTENLELSSAALQTLGFCVCNPKIASLLCEIEIHELLSLLNSVAINSGDKHIRTRALWVISKQFFPPDTVGKLVPNIIAMLETILKGDSHSMVVEHEALNVIIRLLEQAPSDMEEQAVTWAKMIIPLLVHSAHKVQLKAASALEMGLPLLQQRQEVIAVAEQLLTTKVIPELQKLFFSKHETYILKLWPLFVKLLGKTLHHSGSFINSLLHLEELGFRSGSPVVKKIAFIAWKSLIDNFALNPDILCSAKRLKLLMQPLTSIHVRTETLALTKLEVWWYLLMRLGSQLPVHFEQVCVPLIQNTLSLDASLLQENSSRLISNQNIAIPGCSRKSGVFPFGNVANPRMTLNSSNEGAVIPSIQLLGIEMLLHFFMGPEVLTFAKENNIVLSLEPLQYPVITSPSFFCKYASVFINAAQDGFIAIGKDVSDFMLTAIWRELVGFVKAAIDSGNKRDRQHSEVLTMLLQTLKNIILSKELPVLNSLPLLEVAIKELPPKVLGSPAYQIADMDLLNGTPALFLVQLLFCEDLLKFGVENKRFFLNYETLVECTLSGPASPLAFTQSVLTIVSESALHFENKEYVWRMWSIIVNPLIECIKQTNEVNQGDALEHNFNAIYCALLLPVNCIFSSSEFPEFTMKKLLRSWSELYKAFARCTLLVPTADDNVCCEELCAKIISGLKDEERLNQSMLDGLSHITAVMVECINFAPYDVKFPLAHKPPQNLVEWARREKNPLGKMSSLIKLLIILMNSLQMLISEEFDCEPFAPLGFMIVGILHNIIGRVSLPSMLRPVLRFIAKPFAALYEKIQSCNQPSKLANPLSPGLNNKCEKLLADSLTCFQTHYPGSFDDEVLGEIFPLLSVMFSNRNRLVCSHAVSFWNATFGKARTMEYPEELKPILNTTRQKFILLLPNFESCEIMEGSSTTYSDYTENSQWGASISGIKVNPNGKRDSFLARTGEPEEENIDFHITPKKIKLELSGTKSNIKNIPLEEENTVDFVYIPVETKKRVLTEHQKEVLRTKRDDIPVMYNNLDVSQDVLFSQDTQNQEESLEIPIIVDVKQEHEKKEDKSTPQKKEATSLVIPHGVTGNYKSNISLENITSTVSEQPNSFQKENLDLKNEELNICVPIQSPILDSTLNENPPTSSSNSSASSDIISATPQVVVNRRQAFVTLEKFDDAESRPFSPSVFSNITVTLTNPFIQNESPVVSDVSSKDKPNLENKGRVKFTARKTMPGTRRTRSEFLNALEMCVKAKRIKEENSPDPKLQPNNTDDGLRQNKTLDDKASEQIQSDQEEKNQVSDTPCEDKHEISVDTQIAEHSLDNQSQIPGAGAADSTTMESKVLLDIVKNENVVPNLEHKENTATEVDVREEVVPDVNQSPDISLNQKTLRRSLRRKAETDGAVDSQDNENNQQKKDNEKDDEKIMPKKMAQNKETSGQKEKAETLEKAADAPICVPINNATENINSKENSQEELDMSLGKSERSPAASDLEESGPDTSVEKHKVFPRYHTRRAASQGLLASMENSESDISETREEGAKKRRSGKLKKNDSPGNQAKPDSQELSSQAAVEIQTRSVGKQKITSSGKTEVPSMSNNAKDIKQDKSTPPLSPCVDLKENAGLTRPRASSDTGRKAANRRESTSEPVLENGQETSALDTSSVVPINSNDISEDHASATAVGALPSPKRILDMSECQHKRSKRTRKSRSCECCDEKLSPQVEKLSSEPKKASTPEPKLKEPRKNLSKVTVALTLIPVAEEIHFAQRLNVEPCATSTPLPFVKDAADWKEASNVAKSVSGVPRNKSPNVEPEKLACVQSENDKPVAGIPDVPFSETISESRSMDSQSEMLSAQGQPLEPGSVDSHSEMLRAKDQDLEPGPMDSHSEEVSAKDQPLEPGSVDSHSEMLSAKDQPLEPGPVDSHSEEVSAMDQPLEPGRMDSHSEEVSAKDQPLESGSVDSHSEESVMDQGLEPDSMDSCSEESVMDQGLEPGSMDSHSEESVMDQGLEPGSMDSHSEEVSAKDRGLEPDAEAETGMEVCSNQNGHLESETDTEIKIIQVVGAQPEESVVQNTVEETAVTSATQVAELQENETSEEEGAEDNAANAPSQPSTLVMWQNKISTLDSPPKCKELDFLSLAKVSGSPTGTQARCLWSPSASPSTSILKRAIKREPEEDSSSPANKNRRVSFANPIYQEELADDIDRRSPILRIHPCNNGSQSSRSAKSSSSHQAKLITTPTKGSLSPGTRSHKYKSSKKCLITEMGKESTSPVPTESVYPALMGCKASVDIILPQITSNTWTRGLGHLIRAKNIRTVGDLSSLTAAEIKTLPIRSPRVLNVRKVLKGYHEQQVKSRGMEENTGLDNTEKSEIHVMDDTFFSSNENADQCEPEVSSSGESSAIDLWTQVNLLADQLSSERLRNYSGNELFEMQEKLHSMTDCIMKTLKTRWMLSRSCETTV